MNAEKKESGEPKDQKKGEGKPANMVFRETGADEKLKALLSQSYQKHNKTAKSIPNLTELIKKDLDAKAEKGWSVFAGYHLSGVACFIKGKLIDAEVDGLCIIAFQCFCPE